MHRLPLFAPRSGGEMSRQRPVIDPSTGEFKKTPIGELHAALCKAGIKVEIYKGFRTHLRVMLRHIGRQPDSIEINDDVCGQIVVLKWSSVSDLAVLTVKLEELPF
jgi:hypothetical protein